MAIRPPAALSHRCTNNSIRSVYLRAYVLDETARGARNTWGRRSGTAGRPRRRTRHPGHWGRDGAGRRQDESLAELPHAAPAL